MLSASELDKSKHQHNLEALQDFKHIVSLGMVDINNVIVSLKIFRAEAVELKSAVTEIELARAMSLSVYIDILKDGVVRLKQFKNRLDGRMKTKYEHDFQNDDRFATY